jgi:transposase
MMLPPSVRILVCTLPQDMRKSFDTLALVVKQYLSEDPQNGSLYVFVGKSANRVKVLWWDQNGYCLLYKRLHRSLIQMPIGEAGQGYSVRIDGAALRQMLSGVGQEKKHAACS